MKSRILGRSGLKISAIGLGTGQIGSRPWGYGTKYSDDDISRILEATVNCGITLIDSAETYGYGLSERAIGRAIKKYGRDNFLVLTKVAPWNLRYDSVLKAAQRSLGRLETNIIDLYLIHYPNPFVPLKETMRAMEHLVKAGKVRNIGLSNFNSSLVRRAQENCSTSEIVVNEIEYNIFTKFARLSTVEFCSSHKIGIIAYSPLAGGILTGRYSPENLPNDRARAFNFHSRQSFLERNEGLFACLGKIAEARRASVAQVALSYIIQHPSVAAIPAALNVRELKENAESSEMKLDDSENRLIEENTIPLSLPIRAFDHGIVRPISWMKEGLKRQFSRPIESTTAPIEYSTT